MGKFLCKLDSTVISVWPSTEFRPRLELFEFSNSLQAVVWGKIAWDMVNESEFDETFPFGILFHLIHQELDSLQWISRTFSAVSTLFQINFNSWKTKLAFGN